VTWLTVHPEPEAFFEEIAISCRSQNRSLQRLKVAVVSSFRGTSRQ
jgi:hypothetical protein